MEKAGYPKNMKFGIKRGRSTNSIFTSWWFITTITKNLTQFQLSCLFENKLNNSEKFNNWV
jgi:hypothetical protein